MSAARSGPPPSNSYLGSTGLGEPAFGYAIPQDDPATTTVNEHLRTLPSGNLDFSVRFSEDTDVAQSDLRVEGAPVPDYAVAGFAYDPGSFTATWTLAQPLTPYDLQNNKGTACCCT